MEEYTFILTIASIIIPVCATMLASVYTVVSRVKAEHKPYLILDRIENISNLDIEYDDEGGNFINFKLNGKARLPRLDEVYGDGKCSSSVGSCPLWLLNYLASSPYVTGDRLQNISEIYGYWTLSSSAENSIFAWWVDNDGFAWYDIAIDGSIGARPVINVKL